MYSPGSHMFRLQNNYCLAALSHWVSKLPLEPSTVFPVCCLYTITPSFLPQGSVILYIFQNEAGVDRYRKALSLSKAERLGSSACRLKTQARNHIGACLSAQSQDSSDAKWFTPDLNQRHRGLRQAHRFCLFCNYLYFRGQNSALIHASANEYKGEQS